jgi:hypothetical protein
MGTSSSTAAAHSARAVTPHNTDLLTGGTCRALYIGTTGNIAVLMADGTTATFTAVPVGILPVQVQRVNSTNTTASNIVALY